jgi:lipopolysaccharide biosynthesis glycosyltransferase
MVKVYEPVFPTLNIRVFIGYDSSEPVAYHIFCHSIQTRSSVPVSITPIMLSQISEFNRPRDLLQSTEFSFSRFLVPYLSNYQGWSLFFDCDMLMMSDIKQLWDLRDEQYAVMCVKHDYEPKEDKKFLGHIQTKYKKKNWSSVMLFNNAQCRILTPGYVRKASGMELHQFQWTDEALIGEIPKQWNHLVGVYKKLPAKNIHFTLGGPYFNDYSECDYSDVWYEEYEKAVYCKQWKPKGYLETEDRLEKV